MGPDRRITRRRFAKLAAGGSLSSLAGCTNLRIKRNQASGVRPATRFRLAAEEGEWVGLDPKQIEDERGPILRTTPDEEVEITWVNRDGDRHAFAIEDSTGNVLVESPTIAQRGASTTVTFEASQEMTAYLDPYTPVLMRGTLLVTRS